MDPVKTIHDFEAGRLYTVSDVAKLLRYTQHTVRKAIRLAEKQPSSGAGIKAVRMPVSGLRVRRPKQPAGRPNYRIDGAEVLRLWGQMNLDAARTTEAMPLQSTKSEANRVKGAFDRLAKLGGKSK